MAPCRGDSDRDGQARLPYPFGEGDGARTRGPWPAG